MANKLDEAAKFMKEAEKCMKTGFLKWKPDLDGAAAAYTTAAIAYKNGNALSEAKNAYERAAECQLENSQLFHSAKSYEAAAFIAKDMKDLQECVKLIDRASNMYLENGTPDTAVLSIARAARIIEVDDIDRAVELYSKAAHVHEVQNQIRQASEVIRPAARILVRNGRYDEAVSLLQKELNYNAEASIFPIVHRLTACMVLLHLTRGDCVAADKSFKHSYVYQGFSESDEASLLEQLLDSLNEGDEDKSISLLKNALFTHLDNDFAVLARKLCKNLPDDLVSAVPQVSKSSGDPDAAESDDEYEDGLL